MFIGSVTDGLDCLLSMTNANWNLNGTLTLVTNGASLALGGGGMTSSITYVAQQPLVNGYDPNSCAAVSVGYNYGGQGQAIGVSAATITVDFSSNGGGTLTGTETPSNQGAVTGGGPAGPGIVPMCDPVVGNPVLTGMITGNTYAGTWVAGNALGLGMGSAFGTSSGHGTFSLMKQ